jgi:hypothetical protein
MQNRRSSTESSPDLTYIDGRRPLLLRSEVEAWVRGELTEQTIPSAVPQAAPTVSSERRAPRDHFVARAEAALRARGRLG